MKKDNFPLKKSIGLLIDPDKYEGASLANILSVAGENSTDYILTGGSLTFHSVDDVIEEIRRLCRIPVVLFPGNLLQLTLKADIIMLLSLISGRNPELLIGNHVLAAPYLKDAREKLVPVGYMLISSGSRTSVEYISQTGSIPSSKPEIAAATAMAGEMLGLKMIYLEAGSGADKHVPLNIIEAVRDSISIPIAVGGGIVKPEEIESIYSAGADLIILGNGCEKNPDLLRDACRIRDRIKGQAT